MRRPTRIPYAGIICRLHGQVDIEKQDYDHQMSIPNAHWRCPICKQNAEFDDARFQEINPQE